MFNLNPLNLPDAQLQQLIMLFVAGTLGFIIGYVSRRNTVQALENKLTGLEQEVDDCLRVVPAGASNGEAIILERVRSRAGELNFDRIGLATAAEADDLKAIVGIGPFLERKLNAIGIYTFRQIASFDQDDIRVVNEVIEFFPGRIQLDNWVEQAAELARAK